MLAWPGDNEVALTSITVLDRLAISAVGTGNAAASRPVGNFFGQNFGLIWQK